jgi:hypothetical protein
MMNKTNRFTISVHDQKLTAKIGTILATEGVVVITDVFSSEETRYHRNNIINGLEKICPAFATDRSFNNLPFGPGKGLIQSLVHIKPITDLRQDSRLSSLWDAAYVGTASTPTEGHYRLREGYVQSCDGINVMPWIPNTKIISGTCPVGITQTVSSNIAECVQGQIVLNESTGCFTCTPRSHKAYELVTDLTINNTPKTRVKLRNVNKFKDKTQKVRAALTNKKLIRWDDWQIPIEAPPGSVILWLSTTIHSDMLQSNAVLPMSNSADIAYRNWRCVVYMCLRPRAEVDNRHIERLRTCYFKNRLTTNWGSHMFPLSFWHTAHHTPHPLITHYQKNPKLIYNDHPELIPQIDSAIATITVHPSTQIGKKVKKTKQQILLKNAIALILQPIAPPTHTHII